MDTPWTSLISFYSCLNCVIDSSPRSIRNNQRQKHMLGKEKTRTNEASSSSISSFVVLELYTYKLFISIFFF
ncbi:hypothetical protein NC651_007385 [Populus alba x Populus x berolinensis]|nr:hypothetical protein NC651_007385 [Populus alba x Populus x berolinensis]